MNFFLLFRRAESSLKSIHSLAMWLYSSPRCCLLEVVCWKTGSSSTWCVPKGYIHSAEGRNHYPICEPLYAIRSYSCLHRDKRKVKLSISQACCSSFNEECYWLYWLAMSPKCYPTSWPSSPVDSGQESHEADFMPQVFGILWDVESTAIIFTVYSDGTL
jgi:hypothetical protein